MAVVGGEGEGSSSTSAAAAAAAIGDKWPQYVIALRAWRASRQEWVEKTLAQRVHERQHMNEVRTPLPPSLPTFHLRALVLLGFACFFALADALPLPPCHTQVRSVLDGIIREIDKRNRVEDQVCACASKPP